MRLFLFLLQWQQLFLLLSIYCCMTHSSNEKETTLSEEETEDSSNIQSAAKEQFGDPKFQELRKKYWEDTFREIRNLGDSFASSGEQRLFSQWKLLLEDDSSSSTSENNRTKASLTRKRAARFEGFPSWDRLLQDWADDVQEYLEQAESADGYSFGNYGRPLNFSSSETNTTAAPAAAAAATITTKTKTTVWTNLTTIAFPTNFISCWKTRSETTIATLYLG